jgi:hypothetical protein
MKFPVKFVVPSFFSVAAIEAFAQGQPSGGVTWGQAAAIAGVAFAVGVAVGYAAGKSSGSSSDSGNDK